MGRAGAQHPSPPAVPRRSEAPVPQLSEGRQGHVTAGHCAESLVSPSASKDVHLVAVFSASAGIVEEVPGVCGQDHRATTRRATFWTVSQCLGGTGVVKRELTVS